MTVAKIARGGVIAALYFALTMALAPISFGNLQFRVSEALTLLPFLFPEAVPGLAIGCLAANLFGSPLGILDTVLGSLATLLAAICVYKCRVKWLTPLFPVALNASIVGGVLAFYLAPDAMWAAFPMFALEVAVGELGACCVLGLPLLITVERVMPMLKRSL